MDEGAWWSHWDDQPHVDRRGRTTEVESGILWLEAETGDTHAKAELMVGIPDMDPHR